MPKTLLLADASVTMRKVVEMSFASEDVVVITADTGQEAIEKARSQRPDALLVNVSIPGPDGYEVCQAIKGDPALAHTPVLLLTGTFEPFDEERAEQVGADGRIMKPFESQVLVDQVNALLERSAAAAAAGAEPAPAEPDAASAGDDAFDFFDDDLVEAEVAPIEPTPDLGDDLEPLELEPVAVDPREELPAEAEAEVLPEAEELGSDDVLGEPADEVASLAEEVEAAPLEPLDEAPEPLLEEAAYATTGSEGFGTPPDADATRLYEEPELPTAAPSTPEDGFDLDFSSPPLDPPTPPDLEAEPDRPAAGDPLADLGPEELVGEAQLDPTLARAHEVSSSDLGEPLPDDPGSLPTQPAEPFAQDSPPAAEPTAPPGASRESSAAELEALRQPVRESLEKLAWEAFGDVSDRIVREAVQRIEAIAWEVIPQMAETLIREEIRRLKGEDPA